MIDEKDSKGIKTVDTSSSSVDSKKYSEQPTYSSQSSDVSSNFSIKKLDIRYDTPKTAVISSTETSRKQERLLHINKLLKKLRRIT